MFPPLAAPWKTPCVRTKPSLVLHCCTPVNGFFLAMWKPQPFLPIFDKMNWLRPFHLE